MIEGLSIFAKYAGKDAAVGGVGFNSEVMLGRWLKPISEADQARLRELVGRMTQETPAGLQALIEERKAILLRMDILSDETDVLRGKLYQCTHHLLEASLKGAKLLHDPDDLYVVEGGRTCQDTNNLLCRHVCLRCDEYKLCVFCKEYA